MFDKYFKNNKSVDFKKRLYVLIGILICLFIAVFIVAIEPTLVLRNESNFIEKQYQSLQNNPETITALKSKIQSYQKNSGNTVTQNITDILSKYCASNGLKVSYPTPQKTQNGNLEIATNIFVLTGSFQKITQLAYYIEKEKKIGKIVSLQYTLNKNFETRASYLQATLYVQTIKNIENEK